MIKFINPNPMPFGVNFPSQFLLDVENRLNELDIKKLELSTNTVSRSFSEYTDEQNVDDVASEILKNFKVGVHMIDERPMQKEDGTVSTRIIVRGE